MDWVKTIIGQTATASAGPNPVGAQLRDGHNRSAQSVICRPKLSTHVAYSETLFAFSLVSES